MVQQEALFIYCNLICLWQFQYVVSDGKRKLEFLLAVVAYGCHLIFKQQLILHNFHNILGCFLKLLDLIIQRRDIIFRPQKLRFYLFYLDNITELLILLR